MKPMHKRKPLARPQPNAEADRLREKLVVLSIELGRLQRVERAAREVLRDPTCRAALDELRTALAGKIIPQAPGQPLPRPLPQGGEGSGPLPRPLPEGREGGGESQP